MAIGKDERAAASGRIRGDEIYRAGDDGWQDKHTVENVSTSTSQLTTFIVPASQLLGPAVAKALETLSLEIYHTARNYATSRGIILADTKFEFALDPTSTPSNPILVLVDEVLTPDSSRFWRADDYEVGRGQKSLDKQFLRDWLTKEGLKGKEEVSVPEEVVKGTVKAYEEAYEMLTGKAV